ncbi:MAG: hypothetical protein F6K09_03565 [Merismopedia sp. SIO2A8]|nr:hypothetical protein [Merismopedia sp. SIO2A8]
MNSYVECARSAQLERWANFCSELGDRFMVSELTQSTQLQTTNPPQ